MDLARQRELQRRRHRRRDLSGYFVDVLPQLVMDKAETFLTLSGTIAFLVRGKEAWTLRLGCVDAPLTRGVDPKADVTLCFVPSAFAEFVDGRLDLEASLRDRRVRVRGDVGVLKGLQALTAPTASPLATRLGGVGT